MEPESGSGTPHWAHRRRRLLELKSDDYAWAKIDHIHSTSESGRLRFFCDRRGNLPGMSEGEEVKELPISEEAGLVEPTHVVLVGDPLCASAPIAAAWVACF